MMECRQASSRSSAEPLSRGITSDLMHKILTRKILWNRPQQAHPFDHPLRGPGTGGGSFLEGDGGFLRVCSPTPTTQKGLCCLEAAYAPS